MNFIKVEESNIDVLFDLNYQLAADENQEELYTAQRDSYASAFLSKNPIAYAFLSFIEDQPAGFYLYSFKFASYTGSPVFYIEDIYLREAFRSPKNKLLLLNHAIDQSIAETCSRVEMRVLRAFNLGGDIIESLGFNPVTKWDVFRLENNY